MGHYGVCFRALSSLLEKCFLPFLEEASTVTSPQTNEMLLLSDLGHKMPL